MCAVLRQAFPAIGNILTLTMEKWDWAHWPFLKLRRLQNKNKRSEIVLNPSNFEDAQGNLKSQPEPCYLTR